MGIAPTITSTMLSIRWFDAKQMKRVLSCSQFVRYYEYKRSEWNSESDSEHETRESCGREWNERKGERERVCVTHFLSDPKVCRQKRKRQNRAHTHTHKRQQECWMVKEPSNNEQRWVEWSRREKMRTEIRIIAKFIHPAPTERTISGCNIEQPGGIIIEFASDQTLSVCVWMCKLLTIRQSVVLCPANDSTSNLPSTRKPESLSRLHIIWAFLSPPRLTLIVSIIISRVIHGASN